MDYNIEAIDMETLNQTRSILKTRWPEMIEAYLKDSASYIENIKIGFSNDDKQAVASNAHPLKSSSASIGVVGVEEIAKEIEHQTKDAIEGNQDIAHLKELVQLLEDAFNLAEPKLRATL